MKITDEAKKRCIEHTLQAQLAQHADQLRREQAHDQSDIEVAFEADKSWSGQHARLNNPKGFES